MQDAELLAKRPSNNNPTLTMRELAFTVMASRLMSI